MNIGLIEASKSGDLASVTALLNSGAGLYANPTRRKTPLAYAAENGHTSIMEALLQGRLNRHYRF